MADCIKRGGYFCVEARDAFTNETVRPNAVKIFINGQPPAMIKEERYFVFYEVGAEHLKIHIQAAVYEEREYEAVLQVEQEIYLMPDGIAYPVCGTVLFSILLYPNENYRLPDGYDRKIIACNPEEEIKVIKDKGKCTFLKDAYCGGDVIQMYLPEENGIEGRYFRIMEQEAMAYEDFLVVGQMGKAGYRMKEALKGNYGKGSKVYELYRTRADRQGNAAVIMKEAFTVDDM